MSDETKPVLSATTDEAPNTALDAVTDLALDATIPAPIRRNMFKAFDRLCSALIDIPVGVLERRSFEKRAESEARIKIIRENADQIAEQMKVDPEYARIAVSKYGKKILREQVNLDKISAIAANELTEDGPDSSVNQSTSEPNEMQSVDSTNQEANSGEEKTIDDDWLNNFETQARQVSTEEMQLRFGRILAGEIKNPGSFSIRALKTFGELDQSVAILFQRLCSVCVVMEFPLTKHVAEMKDRILGRDHGSTSKNDTISRPYPAQNITDMKVPSLGRDPGNDNLDKYGLGFEELNVLNEYGLIISVYNSVREYRLLINNENVLPIIEFWHQRKKWILLPSPNWDKSQEFKLSSIAFSRIGRELYSVVEQQPLEEYTEDLKKFFTERNLTMIEA